MTTGCPVCNGLSDLYVYCARCGQPLEDIGRLLDLFGDYSPYRPINDLKKTDGIEDDLAYNQCPHSLYCWQCGDYQLHMVAERSLP
ncbi:hypothetical protein GCM10011571_05020 [Marinithermofilum abyssi]|uniref:Uncharacterized protein n=1 Tax=Marinithermofilum abyssi TaxID=1571185 RepID=A0A8J2VE85_9BACL|nr:hypothetical protein [Marinithermofilum abyssi]GGE06871.1 hypothetical protein GCM10011571_05020 [Marinithermofilum abyssi]